MQTFEDVMHRLSGRQKEVLNRKLFRAAGGEQSGVAGLKAILDGDMAIVLRRIFKKRVDRHGRCTPFAGMKGKVVDTNHNFRLAQPKAFDFSDILCRLQRHFGVDTTFVSAEEFEGKSNELVAQIRADKRLENLLEGCHLPICLPKFEVKDYGTVLEGVFLAAVERAYKEEFAGRRFQNWRKGKLAGHVGVVTESRHQKLLDQMKERPVVGLYFPNPLQGFSPPADREMVSMMPEGFLLSGALDTAIAMAAYPDVLARDWNTPGLDCSANTWRSSGYSLGFKALDGRLDFVRRRLVAFGSYSGGLLFLG